jgi:polyribonucleotide nucleotidyltransferase
MFEVYRKEITWGGKLLTFETGKIARQADGAVMVTYGGTTVLCTAVGSPSAKQGIDFFPLTVNYQEKSFAAGRIPGGFFKREGRPSEKETLVSRLIDRPIRPLFHKNYKNETQIIATVLAHDMENDPDIVAMIGASAALTISGLPFMGPIGACRIGWDGKDYILNPTIEQMKDQSLDLVVAGTKEGVLMVESEATELSEEIMLGAVDYGHEEIGNVIKAIIELAEVAAKEPRPLPEEPSEKSEYSKLIKPFRKKLEKAYKEIDKSNRSKLLSEIRNEIFSEFDETSDYALISSLTKDLEADVVRGSILKTKKELMEEILIQLDQL